MIIYTRSFFNIDDKFLAKKAFNISMYEEISITSSERTANILKSTYSDENSKNTINSNCRFLVATKNYCNGNGYTFAVIDINTCEFLQELMDDIIQAIAENKSVYYVEDFYKKYENRIN